jgi:hypothetical protein
MATLNKTLIAAAMGAGILAFSTMNASAAIVCNGDVCWHSHETYAYPPSAHVIIHPDSWRWGPSEHFSFREHAGRGYWEGGRWRAW